tara:strand:- start:2075 stop:2395 length:321 start_codon:yes stop_codon:yes gene_type:complete
MTKTFLSKDENLFSYVVQTFKSSALISLGKTRNPMTKKVDINLEQAKYYLDILAMLQKKTKNNLSEYEKQMLTNNLSEVKMSLIEVKQSVEYVDKNSKGTDKSNKK